MNKFDNLENYHGMNPTEKPDNRITNDKINTQFIENSLETHDGKKDDFSGILPDPKFSKPKKLELPYKFLYNRMVGVYYTKDLVKLYNKENFFPFIDSIMMYGSSIKPRTAKEFDTKKGSEGDDVDIVVFVKKGTDKSNCETIKLKSHELGYKYDKRYSTRIECIVIPIDDWEELYEFYKEVSNKKIIYADPTSFFTIK